jgi:hypothetical protein
VAARDMSIKGWAKENLDTIQTVGIILGLVFTGGSFLLQNQTLKASNAVASADHVLRVSDDLDKPEYKTITAYIQSGTSSTSLLTHGFTTDDIENYISNFETLGDLSIDKVIDPLMAYNELSYDMEKAWCNVDVEKDIAQDRKEDGNLSGPLAFFNGFEYLAKYSLAKDHKDCAAMDKE